MKITVESTKMDNVMNQPDSIFDRLIASPRPAWVTASVGLLLFLLPFTAAYLDGRLNASFANGDWRILLLYPAIVVYILIVSPAMGRVGNEVIAAFRPLVDMEDADFDRLINQAARTNPLHEWLAFIIGAALGILSARGSEFDVIIVWMKVYWYFSSALMYGMLAWTIFVSISSTRLNRVLHSQPLHFDILDPTTFEAVGRQSLLLALVFIGGLTLSLVFAFRMENLTQPEALLFYLPVVAVIVLIFFLGMHPTHQALSREKKRLLGPVQNHIHSACRTLVQRLETGQDSASLPAEINALSVYEQRLLAARTWPYNTAMLRTLFFSVFIPLVTVLGRLVVEAIYR